MRRLDLIIALGVGAFLVEVISAGAHWLPGIIGGGVLFAACLVTIATWR